MKKAPLYLIILSTFFIMDHLHAVKNDNPLKRSREEVVDLNLSDKKKIKIKKEKKITNLPREILAQIIDYLPNDEQFSALNNFIPDSKNNNNIIEPENNININDNLDIGNRLDTLASFLKKDTAYFNDNTRNILNDYTDNLNIMSEITNLTFKIYPNVEEMEMLSNKFPNIETINIQHVLWNIDKVKKLAIINTLQHFKKLTHLNISSNGLGPEHAASIAKLTNLEHLNIKRNFMGHEGARLLTKLTNLTKLDISDNKIRALGAKAIATMSKLIKLNIQFNKIENEGAIYLANLINLTKLIIYDNKIEATGAIAIATMTHLKYLDIQFNNIGNEGIEAIRTMSNYCKVKVSIYAGPWLYNG